MNFDNTKLKLEGEMGAIVIAGSILLVQILDRTPGHWPHSGSARAELFMR